MPSPYFSSNFNPSLPRVSSSTPSHTSEASNSDSTADSLIESGGERRKRQKKYRRIPRDYRGIQPTGRDLSSLLGDVLEEIYVGYSTESEVVLAAWPELVGEQIGKMSRAVAFSRGIVKVEVANSTLYSLLKCQMKQELLDQLRKRFPQTDIADIFFRMG